MLFGDIDADVEQSERKIRSEMSRIVTDMFSRAAADHVTLRDAALAFTQEKMHDIDAQFGLA